MGGIKSRRVKREEEIKCKIKSRRVKERCVKKEIIKQRREGQSNVK
jgi:hypothetical protein